MSLLDAGQDVARTLHAVDVIVTVRERLEEAADDTALHHFHRLSPDELVVLVELETGVLTPVEVGARMSRRYPLSSLLTATGLAPADLAHKVRLDSAGVRRARRSGFDQETADRAATLAGFHPHEVWPEMEQHALDDAAAEELRVQEQRRAAWRRHEAKRMQDPAYRAAKAEYLRQYRATSAKAEKASHRRYYLANRERLLAKQRERDARRRGRAAA